MPYKANRVALRDVPFHLKPIQQPYRHKNRQSSDRHTWALVGGNAAKRKIQRH
jgi:hypothetical protein